VILFALLFNEFSAHCMKTANDDVALYIVCGKHSTAY